MGAQSIITLCAIYIACYLIGAINFSLIFASRVLHRNLREEGSGNPGFTNLLRTGSRKIAVTVLLLDIGRAWLVMFVCARIPLDIHWPFVAFPLILGNIFPVFHKFRGGKGIAMSIGIILALSPWAAAAGTISLILVIAIWKHVSAGSLAFLVSATVTTFLIAPTAVSITCGILTAAGFLTHRENLRRLISGTESTIQFHKNGSNMRKP